VTRSFPDARSQRESANANGSAGAEAGAHTRGEHHARKHHELSSKVLRLAAADAGVLELIAYRVALGIAVEPGDRDRVLAALAARGVNVADLPCVRTGNQ